MKAVILAGGLGTRISEESHLRPKPMIEIGGKPLLWHIMKIYLSYGINDFIICTGYKGYIIKEYFANYFLHQSDVTFDMCKNEKKIHNNTCEQWKVTIVDTGENTNTGGRIKKIQKYVENETFCFTYGDGVSDINIIELINFHKNQNSIATLTSIQPPGRYGAIETVNNKVINFEEKPKGDSGWVNGGFFVLEPDIFNYIEDNDEISFESDTLVKMTTTNNLSAYKHDGFWLSMDTLRDKTKLEELWVSGNAPWKVWK